MTMGSSARHVLVVGVAASVLFSCSSDTTPDTTPDASPTSSTATEQVHETDPSTEPQGSTSAPGDDQPDPLPVNAEVTDRARAALTQVGAQRLVLQPGYDQEVNTALEGVWRGHRLVAYVAPTSELSPTSELAVVARRQIKGQAVGVVRGQHSTVRRLRFVLGPDTWLLSVTQMTKSVELARALLS